MDGRWALHDRSLGPQARPADEWTIPTDRDQRRRTDLRTPSPVGLMHGRFDDRSVHVNEGRRPFASDVSVAYGAFAARADTLSDVWFGSQQGVGRFDGRIAQLR